ncbi:hypothetical protein QBC44DRAFT_127027 [Cladorrhinum sp. PSN332]|nr:hypothetical protein QBC44DRAFT_127027 [Cladorrhinum sp. PSN332]
MASLPPVPHEGHAVTLDSIHVWYCHDCGDDPCCHQFGPRIKQPGLPPTCAKMPPTWASDRSRPGTNVSVEPRPRAGDALHDQDHKVRSRRHNSASPSVNFPPPPPASSSLLWRPPAWQAFGCRNELITLREAIFGAEMLALVSSPSGQRKGTASSLGLDLAASPAPGLLSCQDNSQLLNDEHPLPATKCVDAFTLSSTVETPIDSWSLRRLDHRHDRLDALQQPVATPQSSSKNMSIMSDISPTALLSTLQSWFSDLLTDMPHSDNICLL